MSIVIGDFLGYPNISPPFGEPIVTPFFISMGCGQDVAVDSLATVTNLIINCQPFNGSDPLIQEVYKDGELIQRKISLSLLFTSPSDDNFGTYTFALSTEKCGTVIAVSRIVRKYHNNNTCDWICKNRSKLHKK